MDVTREDVLHCAALARLNLEESEIEPLRQAMAQILAHAASLDELLLEGIPPMVAGFGRPLPRRPDEPGPSFTQDQALALAPETAEGKFSVPKVL